MNRIKQFEPLFGRWYAECLLDEGSFGRVYKIYRDELNTRFYSALKHISIPADKSEIKQHRMNGMDNASISTYYGEMVKDIQSEIRLMERLHGNTNIVSFEDSMIIPKEDGIGYDVFIRMELLTPLADRMAESVFSTDDVVKLGVDICSALGICKEYGIIHRDIKPENIFISNNGNYKLGDFGIARSLEKTSTYMSKKGTPNYMAPEVYKGEKYGSSCDTYSLGLVMYRLLNNNRLPFLPQPPKPVMPSDSEAALIKRMSGAPLPAPCNADAELADIVLKACAFNAEERFAAAEEMKAALTGYSRGEHGIVPIVIVADRDQTHDEIDETRGVFGKPIVNKTADESDPNATFGVFVKPQANDENKETEDDPKNSTGAIVGAAVPAAADVNSKNSSVQESAKTSAPASRGGQDKPSKKRPWWIIGVAAALVLALGLMAVLGVFGKKQPAAVDANAETPAPTPTPTPTATPTPKPVSVGDIITLGHYEQDNNETNGKEAIEWIVLAKDGSKVLIISKYALDCKSFHSSSSVVFSWATCSLRKWLNNSFLNKAFSDEEKNKIQNTAVKPDKNPAYGTFYGYDTKDKVFILSIMEANTFFNSDSARQCQGTAFCYSRGALKADNGNCYWVLRSPGSSTSRNAFINDYGSFNYIGFAASNDGVAVRPAMWISLDP